MNAMRLEAKVKRLAQAELKNEFGIHVSIKTIGRKWQRGYRSNN